MRYERQHKLVPPRCEYRNYFPKLIEKITQRKFAPFLKHWNIDERESGLCQLAFIEMVNDSYLLDATRNDRLSPQTFVQIYTTFPWEEQLLSNSFNTDMPERNLHELALALSLVQKTLSTVVQIKVCCSQRIKGNPVASIEEVRKYFTYFIDGKHYAKLYENSIECEATEISTIFDQWCRHYNTRQIVRFMFHLGGQTNLQLKTILATNLVNGFSGVFQRFSCPKVFLPFSKTFLIKRARKPVENP